MSHAAPLALPYSCELPLVSLPAGAQSVVTVPTTYFDMLDAAYDCVEDFIDGQEQAVQEYRVAVPRAIDGGRHGAAMSWRSLRAGLTVLTTLRELVQAPLALLR